MKNKDEIPINFTYWIFCWIFDFTRNIHNSIPDKIICGLKWTKISFIGIGWRIFNAIHQFYEKLFIKWHCLPENYRKQTKKTNSNSKQPTVQRQEKNEISCLLSYYSFSFFALLLSSPCFILSPVFSAALRQLLQVQNENILTFLVTPWVVRKQVLRKAKFILITSSESSQDRGLREEQSISHPTGKAHVSEGWPRNIFGQDAGSLCSVIRKWCFL